MSEYITKVFKSDESGYNEHLLILTMLNNII